MKNEILELSKCNYLYPNAKDPQEEILKGLSYSKEVPPKPEKGALIILPSPQISTPGREFLITGPFEGFTYITNKKKMKLLILPI